MSISQVPADFSVLIVEDDDDARRNMEDILSLDGYQTQSVSHCLPAISAIESRPFDAVIVDWRLPDGDGAQLISLIVAHQPNTPVVVVTGMREFDTAVTALRSGAYDFLLKPINPDLLRSVLNRLVERKQHLLEIEVSQKKLLANERLAAIGEMVAGLAHESRNAFQRSHACLAELSLDLEQMPNSLNLVRKVQKALDDLNFLLEEVRQYSAPIILEREFCSVPEMIQETWQHILDAKKVAHPPGFSIRKSDDFPAQCRLDPKRLQQVIRNLLENALFAGSQNGKTPVDGEIVVDCHVVTSKNRRKIRIDVSDTGEGVPEDKREEIFAPFFTTKTKGTGLGLAISRRIVEAHEGRLSVDQSEHGGARFKIELSCLLTKR